MLTSLKTELKIWIYSRTLFFMVLIIWGAFIASAFFSISVLRSEYDSFERSKSIIADEERIEHILQEPLYDEKGEVNTLLFRKIRVEEIIRSLAPQNALSLCVEFGFYFLPLIMTIIGAITICPEKSNNVSRIRTARYGKWRYLLTKQLVMMILPVAITLVSIILYLPVSYVVFSKATDVVDANIISVSSAQYAGFGRSLLQALFLVACMVIFSEIGFGLGYVTKTPVVPVVVTGIFWFLNMIPTGYEPKNAVYTIASNLQTFYGAAPNGVTSQISLTAAALIVFLMVLIPMSLLLLFWHKNSAFK